jgi:hypothetical protein
MKNVDNVTIIYVEFIFIAKRCDVDYIGDSLSHQSLLLLFATQVACIACHMISCMSGYVGTFVS